LVAVRKRLRWIGGIVSILAAFFCLPATAGDYPESLKWWRGQIAGVDGDAVKNAVFVLALLAFLAFAVGPHVWRRFRPVRVEPPQPVTDFEGLQDFARRFAGWFRSRELKAPPDMASTLGDEWEDRQAARVVSGEITSDEYLNLIQPFIERREWLAELRADYQQSWRAEAQRRADWARDSDTLENADHVALMVIEDPRRPEEFKALAEVFERVVERVSRADANTNAEAMVVAQDLPQPQQSAVPAAQTATADSLALRLRREAHTLSDLRGRLKSDRLGRSVGGPPPEYRSELDQAVQRIFALLKRDREPWAHEFLEEIPERGGLYALIGPEHEADRIHRHAGVYMERLNRMLGRLTTEARAEPERARLLKDAYHDGTRLRKRFVWRGGIPETLEAMKAVEAESWSEAATWAADTWQMLHQHYPGPDERAFFGDPENLSMEKTGVRLNASKERSEGSTVDAYMGRKLDVLSDLLGKVDQ
jgi:hypothetical protein